MLNRQREIFEILVSTPNYSDSVAGGCDQNLPEGGVHDDGVLGDMDPLLEDRSNNCQMMSP